MHKVILCLLVVATVVASQSQITPVRKCKNVSKELFKKVVVTTPRGVCTKLPCDLVRGGPVKTDVTFGVRDKVKQITIKCNATTLGTTIDYPIKDANKGCEMLTNTDCPIDPDTEADLTFKMDVLKIFPKVSLDLVIYMIDQNKNMISCFEVPAKVVDEKN